MVLTPRTLAAAEERLNAYIAKQMPSAEAPKAATVSEGMDVELLREMLGSTDTVVPLSPAPTAVPQELLSLPLSEAGAIDVLRKSQPCAKLSREEVAQVLRAGFRRLLPRYADVMREGLHGTSAFIVLRGKLQMSISRVERQFYQNKPPYNDGSDVPLPTGLGDQMLGPAATFGMLSALVPVSRERNVVTVEPTELFIVSVADVERALRLRGPKSAAAFRSGLEAAFAEGALRNVNFFSTLPPLTIRQLSPLFSLRFHAKGDTLFRQGELGHEMFVILWGDLQVWRQKKRHSPRTMLAEYTGTSTYPWIGEVLQWIPDNLRAGDCYVMEPTLTLSLRVSEIPQFVLLCPGFKALTMSIASHFTVNPKAKAVLVEDDDPECIAGFGQLSPGEKPLKYALHWVRIIGHMLGGSFGQAAWSAAAAAKSHQLQLAKLNTMEWAQDLVTQETAPAVPDDDDDDGPAETIQSRLAAAAAGSLTRELLLASKARFGDSRTILNVAAKKRWRQRWGGEQQIRAELLRQMSKQPGGIKGAIEDGWKPDVGQA